MRYIWTLVDEQFHCGDKAVINESQADREQEIDRRTIEKYIEHEHGKMEVVALELRSGEVHEDREKNEYSIVRTLEESHQDE